MVSTDLKHIRFFVFLLTTLLVGLAAMALLVMGMMSPVTFLFLISDYGLMLAHWFLLVWLVSGFFAGSGSMVVAKGLLAAFPVCIAFAVLLIAIKRMPAAVIPAILGLSSVPFAETLFALWYGIGGMTRLVKGVAHE
jgi:hypothetical protein